MIGVLTDNASGEMPPIHSDVGPPNHSLHPMRLRLRLGARVSSMPFGIASEVLSL